MDYFIQSNYSLEDLENFRDSNGFIDLTSAGIQLTNESREKRGTVDRFKNWVDFNGMKFPTEETNKGDYSYKVQYGGTWYYF